VVGLTQALVTGEWNVYAAALNSMRVHGMDL
jgi:hypothetical protein